jgi:predicted ArsR family transcriptional regulator
MPKRKRPARKKAAPKQRPPKKAAPTTRDQVRALREQNPEMSAVDIARELGVTKERVRQLLVALGLPTVIRGYYPPPAEAGGESPQKPPQKKRGRG